MTNFISAQSLFVPTIEMGKSHDLDLSKKPAEELMTPYAFVLSNLRSESRGLKILPEDQISETSKEIQRMAQEKQEKMAQKDKPDGMLAQKFDKLKKAVGLTSSEVLSQKPSQPEELGEPEDFHPIRSTGPKEEQPVESFYKTSVNIFDLWGKNTTPVTSVPSDDNSDNSAPVASSPKRESFYETQTANIKSKRDVEKEKPEQIVTPPSAESTKVISKICRVVVCIMPKTTNTENAVAQKQEKETPKDTPIVNLKPIVVDVSPEPAAKPLISAKVNKFNLVAITTDLEKPKMYKKEFRAGQSRAKEDERAAAEEEQNALWKKVRERRQAKVARNQYRDTKSKTTNFKTTEDPKLTMVRTKLKRLPVPETVVPNAPSITTTATVAKEVPITTVVARPAATKSLWAQFFAWLFGWWK